MRVWLLGERGMLGQAVRKKLQHWQLPYVGSGQEVDIACFKDVQDFAHDLKITHIIHCAAMTDVDGCESQPDRAYQVNAQGAGFIGQLAAGLKAKAVYVSTDYVFDGESKKPYGENAATAPACVYGRSKLLGELAFRQAMQSQKRDSDCYIVRTSWLFGLQGKNFVRTILRLLQEKETLGVVADQKGRPTYCPDLAQALLALLGLGEVGLCAEAGIYHFANGDAVSWFEFAQAIAKQAQTCGFSLRCKQILALGSEEYPRPAKRPAYSVLSTQKIEDFLQVPIRSWSLALQECLTVWADNQEIASSLSQGV